MKKLILFLAIVLASSYLNVQAQSATESDTLRKDALNVFMDANDYIKKEIPYINYVRDRKVADLYIISTTESTGSGGRVTTFFLVGQGEYEGMADTLKCSTKPDDTYETRRDEETKVLKLGLIRYVAKTPLAKYLNVSFTKPLSETVTSDKWNSWVYKTSLSSSSSGQSTYKSSYFYTTISANRITAKSKFKSSVGLDVETDKNQYLDTTYTSKITDKFATLQYVKSINNHWSVGASSLIESYSYSNLDLTVTLTPGIEYDFFPYSESTRKILTLSYRAGVEINDYQEPTTRFKNSETVGFHTITGSLSIIQKWGSVYGSLSWKNYFFDWSYYRIRFNTQADIRLFKGLSLSLYGSIASVHDQISLPAGNASLEDVLLRRKMQATDYTYSVSFGFSYTFGSIYNNVVNPRFNN